MHCCCGKAVLREKSTVLTIVACAKTEDINSIAIISRGNQTIAMICPKNMSLFFLLMSEIIIIMLCMILKRDTMKLVNLLIITQSIFKLILMHRTARDLFLAG